MTMAQARRQARTRWVLGEGMMALAVIGLLFALVKSLYLTLPYGLIPWVDDLRHLINQLLQHSVMFAWLWQVIPSWDLLYTIWIALVWIGVGGFLLNSARELHGEIRRMQYEIQREGWRREALGRVDTSPEIWAIVIPAASEERWYKKPLGIIALGVIVTLVSAVVKRLLGL